MTELDGKGTLPVDKEASKYPKTDACRKEGNYKFPEIRTIDEWTQKWDAERIEKGIELEGCNYHEKHLEEIERQREEIRKKDEENAKKTKEAIRLYGEDAAYYVNRTNRFGIPKYTVGTLVHTIDSDENEDGTKKKDREVLSMLPGPEGWEYLLKEIDRDNTFRIPEWKINWEPGKPKFPVGSKVKFKFSFGLGHTWVVESIEISTRAYQYVYDLKQDNIIPGRKTVTKKTMIKESQLKSATQAGGRRRTTMKKSRKMRRKTNKKVRKMRRKTNKKVRKSMKEKLMKKIKK